ncbi:MAG TPA: hypothetical protein VKQ73_02080 [Stellaceae bacterium]|nr:hypothetical protein [Stellaceae bacterium]
MSDLVSIPVDAAIRLHRAAGRGEAAALEELAALWPGDPECFLCGAPAAGGNTLTMPDGRQPGRAILAPQCAACAGLPGQVRMHRLTRILRAMWPNWRPTMPAWGRGF